MLRRKIYAIEFPRSDSYKTATPSCSSAIGASLCRSPYLERCLPPGFCCSARSRSPARYRRLGGFGRARCHDRADDYGGISRHVDTTRGLLPSASRSPTGRSVASCFIPTNPLRAASEFALNAFLRNQHSAPIPFPSPSIRKAARYSACRVETASPISLRRGASGKVQSFATPDGAKRLYAWDVGQGAGRCRLQPEFRPRGRPQPQSRQYGDLGARAELRRQKKKTIAARLHPHQVARKARHHPSPSISPATARAMPTATGVPPTSR